MLPTPYAELNAVLKEMVEGIQGILAGNFIGAYLQQILADPERYNNRFYQIIGAVLEENIEEGKKIAAAGHELGNHSYSHDRMILVTPSFVKQELEKTDQLIRAAGYQGDIHFRPPFGKKLFTLPYYLSKTNRKSITWDVDPDSYPDIAANSDKIVEFVLSKTRPGTIILLHVMYPSRVESLKAVRKIIETPQGTGL